MTPRKTYGIASGIVRNTNGMNNNNAAPFAIGVFNNCNDQMIWTNPQANSGRQLSLNTESGGSRNDDDDDGGNGSGNDRGQDDSHDGGLFNDDRGGSNLRPCCVPDIMECQMPGQSLDPNGNDVIKVSCSNDECTEGLYAHEICFNAWEEMLYSYIVASYPNLNPDEIPDVWSTVGYKLVNRACACRCGDGDLRKSNGWCVPSMNLDKIRNIVAVRRNNVTNRNRDRNTGRINFNLLILNAGRRRNNSYVAANCDGDLVEAVNNLDLHDASEEQQHAPEERAPGDIVDFPMVQPAANNVWHFVDYHAVRVRTLALVESMTGCGIFYHRDNLDSLINLPHGRLNKFNIKSADDGSSSNDESRLLVLELLFGRSQNQVNCIFCSQLLNIYSTYPLLDGVLFFSPVERAAASIPVTLDGKTCYLNAICANCTDPYIAGHLISCLICSKPWTGSALIIGSVYSYDILASNLCCDYKQLCTKCGAKIPPPEIADRVVFSAFSSEVSCPRCHKVDYHFIKPLLVCYSFQRQP